MRSIKTIIANNIKSLRTTKRWTQTDLSEASGVSFRGLQDIESGKSNPRASTLQAIAGAFEISEEKLYLEDLGVKQPQQDLTQIKSLLAAAAKELKNDDDESLLKKISLLEQELRKRDQEIINLKAKLKSANR